VEVIKLYSRVVSECPDSLGHIHECSVNEAMNDTWEGPPTKCSDKIATYSGMGCQVPALYTIIGVGVSPSSCAIGKGEVPSRSLKNDVVSKKSVEVLIWPPVKGPPHGSRSRTLRPDMDIPSLWQIELLVLWQSGIALMKSKDNSACGFRVHV